MKTRFLLITVLFAGSVYGQSSYDEGGFSEVRGFSNVTPEESIDPFSGNLIIVQPDLSVSGRAGLDLKLTRYYNSKIHENFAYNDSPPIFVAPSPVGLGWNLHLGRLYNPAPGNHNGLNSRRRYQSPDGASHEFYRSNDSNCPDCLVSKSGFVLRRNESAWEVSTPDGKVITFAHQAPYVGLSGGLELIWYATSIADVHGNSIDIEYRNDENPLTERWNRHFIQRITDSFGRVFTFNYQESTNWSRLVSISGAGYTIRYEYVNNESFPGYSFLQKVDVGAGLEWAFEYAGVGTEACTFSKLCELTAIVYPYGGRLDYTFETQIFQDVQTHPQRVRVVAEKRQSGPELPGATWSFRYNRGLNSRTDHTVITRPDGSEEAYTFFGPGQYSPFGSAWLYGAILKKELRQNNQVVQELEYEWEKSPSFSNEQYGTVFIGFDQGVSVPLPRRTVIRQDGGTWEVENRNFHPGNHLPQCTRQGGPSGDKFVIQTFRFDSLLERFRFAALPVTQISTFRDVCGQQNISYESGENWQLHTYGATGLLEERNVNGALTNFEYDSFGQLLHQIDYRFGNSLSPTDGVCTVYQDYSFGIARRVFHGADQSCNVGSALYEETTYVDQNGWISGRTNHKGTLSEVEYDALGRKIRVEEDGMNPIMISYAGRLKTHRQGDVEVVSEVDGLGREIARQNTFGGVTATAYDLLGRVAFQSVPSGYTPGSRGSVFEYDALGRRVRMEDERGLVRQYTYSADQMRTEISGPGIVSREEIKEFFSYGGPSQRLLRRLRLPGESASQSSEYTYSVAGDLLTASKNGVTKRAQYDMRRNLVSEQTPAFSALGEAGVARRFHYDSQGNVLCADYGPENGDCGDGWPKAEFVYDRLNRLISTEVTGQPSENAAFEYEGINHISAEHFGQTIIGQKNGIFTQAREEMTYQYDDNLRLQETRWVHPYVENAALLETEVVTSYSYNENGKAERVVYPSGRIVEYTYIGNMPNSVRDNNTVYAEITYYDDISLESFQFGNGVQHRIDRDESFVPSQLRISTPGNTILSMEYDFDALHLLKEVTSNDPYRRATYSYDNRNRLIRANGDWGAVSYEYENNGDRRSYTNNNLTTNYRYADSKLVETIGGSPKTFDYENGRITSMNIPDVGQYLYSYSFAGQLTESNFIPDGEEYSQNSQQFFYHPTTSHLYRRMKSGDGCESDTLYVYSQFGDLIAEMSADGTFLKDYIVLAGRRVAELDYRPRLRVSNAGLNFGEVLVGEERVLEIQLHNDGANDFVLDNFFSCTSHEERANGASNGYSIGCDTRNNPFEFMTTFPITVPARSSVRVPVRFRPTRRIASQRNFAYCSGHTNLQVVFNGIGVAPAAVFEPATVELGDVPLGGEASRSVTVRNDGDAPLAINSWSTSPSTATVQVSPETPWSIAPGESLTFQVTLQADTCPGEVTVQMERESNEAWKPPLTLRANIEGVVFEALEFDFPATTVGQTYTHALALENRAQIAISPRWNLVGPASFALIDGPSPIPPQTSAEIRISYAPRAVLDTPFGDHALVEMRLDDCPVLCHQDIHIRGRHALQELSTAEALDDTWQVSGLAASAEKRIVALTSKSRQSNGFFSVYAHRSLFVGTQILDGMTATAPATEETETFLATSQYDNQGGYRPVLLSAEVGEQMIWGYPTSTELVFFRGDLTVDDGTRCTISGISPRMPVRPFLRRNQGELHVIWFEEDLYAARLYITPLFDSSGACISDQGPIEVTEGVAIADMNLLADDVIAAFEDNALNTADAPTLWTFTPTGDSGPWRTSLAGNLWNPYPQLASAGEGALHAAYTRVFYGQDYEARNVYALVCPDGRIVEEQAIYEHAADNGAPSLVADESGRPMVAWAEGRCGAEGSKKLYFARRSDAAQTWQILDVTPAEVESVHDGVALEMHDGRLSAAWIVSGGEAPYLQLGTTEWTTTATASYLGDRCQMTAMPADDGGQAGADVAVQEGDAGVPSDAAPGGDASPANMDAGTLANEGGPTEEAGVSSDAGELRDAQAPVAEEEAGVSSDAGELRDAQAPVAEEEAGSSEPDCSATCSGSVEDCLRRCGISEDTGPSTNQTQGCLNSQVMSREKPLELFGLALWVVLFRRRKSHLSGLRR